MNRPETDPQDRPSVASFSTLLGRARTEARRRHLGLLACLLLALGALAACGGGSANSTSSTATLGLTAIPNYIFPFAPPLDSHFPNPDHLQAPLYPTLYYMTPGGVDESQSLAYPPQWSDNDRTVTIRLKPYKWSNGTSLTPENVAFWMGLLLTEKQNLGVYTPGYFPDNVKSVSYDDSADSVTFHLTTEVSRAWFIDNQLYTVTPLPLAWDLTAQGKPAQCASESVTVERAQCPHVYQYLTKQAQDLATYTTNPLWKVVDGPWKLGSYQENVSLTLVRNTSYSGPVKPGLKAIREVAYTSPTAMFNALRAGGNLTVAQGLSPTDLPPAGATAQPSVNPLAPDYDFSTPFPADVDGIFLNYRTSPFGALFKQLYFRQALQSLIDQKTIIRVAFNGYAKPEYGPVPLYPPNPYVDATESSDPYPFSISTARRYLTSNGWTIPANGAAYCSKPGSGAGECGAGVPAGKKLVFRLEYQSAGPGSAIVQDLQSNAGKVGIQFALNPKSSMPAYASDLQCNVAHSRCPWDLVLFVGSVGLGPYPTGEALFGTNGPLNFGGYSSPTMDNLVHLSVTTNGGLHAYEDFGAKQLPMIWIPHGPLLITAYASNLAGVPQSLQGVQGYMSMNDWHFVK